LQAGKVNIIVSPSPKRWTVSDDGDHLTASRTRNSSDKRRLASDVYKIMMDNTAEQGFKMEPTSEDIMDLWTIKLFGFDKGSNLNKDMDILGLENVELIFSDLICLHLFSLSLC
jgi:hypothetical protein